jgi:O-antigen chain-terminating methyltransferase
LLDLAALKGMIRNTPLYRPLKTLFALFGYGTYGLPFTKIKAADPLLQNAIARLGPVSGNDNSLFYSYFSEIWPVGYDIGRQWQHEAYLPLIEKNNSKPFLDIGCGAGEFVSFLNAHSIPAIGIDSNASEVARCHAKGLNVVCTDAMPFLNSSSNKYSGISLLEVAEHLPPESLLPLIQACYNALSVGGICIIETLNPNNSDAFNTFFNDPTHTRPITIDHLTFLMQWLGYKETKVLYSSPIARNIQAAYNPKRAYMNYAVVGYK